MNIYKYRDFSNPTEDSFRNLEATVHRHLIWCARPDTLNDPQEFVWKCDCTATPVTLDLLTEILVRARGRIPADARAIAAAAIGSGRLEDLVKPVINGMIEQCRNQIGLAWFGTASDNEILWQRYGGTAPACALNSRYRITCSGRSFTTSNTPQRSGFTSTSSCVHTWTIPTAKRFMTQYCSQSLLFGQTKRKSASSRNATLFRLR
jgi:hypothetical protein